MTITAQHKGDAARAKTRPQSTARRQTSKEQNLSQETLSTIASFLALIFVYTMYHGYRLFTTKVNHKVDTANDQLSKVSADLEKTKNDFINFRLEAQYQAGKREAEIAGLKEQIKTLEQHKNDLASLLKREQLERVKEKNEYENKIEGLNTRLKHLEDEREALKRDLDNERRKSQAIPTPAGAVA